MDIGQYEDYLRVRQRQDELAESTVTQYVRRLERFAASRDGAGEPTVDEMVTFLTERGAEGLSGATLNIDKAALRKYLVYKNRLDDAAALREWFAENFRASSSARRDWFDEAELTALYDAADGYSARMGAAVGLLGETGMRVGELVALDVEDVTVTPPSEAKVVIERLKRRSETVTDSRTISPTTADRLDRYLDQWADFRYRDGGRPRGDEPLFVGPSGRLGTESIRHHLNAVADECPHPEIDSDRVSPHKFRHTVGFRLAEQGYTAEQIGEYLGKKSPANVYVSTSEEIVEDMSQVATATPE